GDEGTVGEMTVTPGVKHRMPG
ncbi:MAG: hypothetical protein QOG77_3469, partial [Solirubrobacteraceae bacterium]|nr:hypothetical protein [Solirubrobacteraceae bacterium]